MKKLSIFFAFIFLLFSNNTTFAQDFKDEQALRSEIEQGMVSFVNSIKPVFKDGMAVEEFETSLIGEKNMKTITKEGKALLDKSYKLLQQHASDEQIKKEGFKEFAVVTKLVLEDIKNNKYELDSDEPIIKLLGGDKSGINNELQVQGKPCRWYQLGCHLSNLWGWIKGNGSTVKTLLDIINIIIKWLT